MKFCQSVRNLAIAGCVLVLLQGGVCWAEDEVSALDAAELRQLVAQLGASQFVVRESATMRLYEVGQGDAAAEVMKRLVTATETGDREVRTRARRVIRLLTERMRKDKIDRFLAGDTELVIPGWKQFTQSHGESRVARKVYSELLQEEWPLLETCFPPAGSAELALVRTVTTERFTDLLRRENGYQKISLGTLLAYFHIGAEHPKAVNVQGQLFHIVRISVPLSQRLRGSPASQDTVNGLTRKIVTRWLLETVRENNLHELSAINVTLQTRMFEESKQIAALILKNEKSPTVNKQMAMQVFSALRDPSGIEFIEPYLQDDRLLREQIKRLQLRDIALVCLMDLNGHDVAKIGVKRINSLLRPYDYSTLGFDTPEERQKAFEEYKELQAEKRFQEQKQKKAAQDSAP